MKETESTGDRVGGYRVVRRLATGGTSDVLLAQAEAQGFERPVVLKVLLSRYQRDSEFKATFAREVAAYARLAHPAIVRLHEFFADGDRLVMVLEYIDGPPLSLLRGMLKTVGRPFDDATAIHVAACVFEALAAAHAATDEAGELAPVIHRDVNPSNILVSWDAQVKVADFGVAKVTGVNHQSTAGLIKGTYGYMAPEQVKGETVTPRADVYAGAIVLWEMLTKRRAFIRGALPEIEVLRELAQPRIVSIDTLRPDLDRNLREIIKRALEPRSDRRALTAEEVAATLRAMVSAKEGTARLGTSLALVRHEPTAAQTSMPPSLLETDEAPAGKVFPHAVARLPRPPPAPRPAARVPLRTAPYGAAAVSSDDLLRRPALASQGSSLEKEMPASPLSPEGGEIVIEKGSHAGSPPVAEPEEDDDELGPSSVLGLASALETSSDPKAAARRVSERLRLGPPLAALTAGKPLDAAVDDFVRESQPELGKLPPAPRPLEPLRRDLNAPLVTPSAPVPLGPDAGARSTSAPMPSSFPQMNRTLSMNVELNKPTPLAETLVTDVSTARPPPAATQAVTASMPAVSPPALNPATTLPLAPPMPAATPPPLSARARASSPSYPGLPGSRAPADASRTRDVATTPRATKRSRWFAIVAVGVVGGAAVGAGTLGHRQRQKARAVTVAPAEPAPAFAAVAAVSGTPTPGRSVAASASVAASGSVAARAIPGVTPRAGVGAGVSGAGIAARMGRVTTLGTAPGRRIFVDDRTVGQTPEAVLVKCGVRKIKLGSTGSAQSIDVPCGAEIAVGGR